MEVLGGSLTAMYVLSWIRLRAGIDLECNAWFLLGLGARSLALCDLLGRIRTLKELFAFTLVSLHVSAEFAVFLPKTRILRFE